MVGVTPTPGTVPFDIFYNILTSGYRGTVYPVAPGKRSICAVKAYRYVLDIEDEVDQAVIVFPANVVDRAIQQCGQKGIKSVIVISAGFREVGPKGRQREERLKDICREYGIAMIGPNCLGVINTDPEVQLNASFARKMPERRSHRLPQPVRRPVYRRARLRPGEEASVSRNSSASATRRA